jgi:hypothetical protein
MIKLKKNRNIGLAVNDNYPVLTDSVTLTATIESLDDGILIDYLVNNVLFSTKPTIKGVATCDYYVNTTDTITVSVRFN